MIAEAEVLAAGKAGEGWLMVGEMGGTVAWPAATAVAVVIAEAEVLAAG